MRIYSENICPNCFAAGSPGACCPKCGYNAVINLSPLTLPIGTLLGERYLIGRTLGIGGFGITYLALDRQTNTLCAVKEYFPRSIAARESNYSVMASGQTSAPIFTHGFEVFYSEAKTLARFLGEPLIVQVKDYFEDNRTAYFVMEYLDGLNAKALLRNAGGSLPLDQGMAVLFSILNALSLVHNQGYLHRDISPENIFITRSGQIKLIDFGSTRFFVGERSRNLSVILKPGFAPPEQYSSKGNQGPWTDIYALAATFYCLVGGIKVPEAPDRLAEDTLAPIATVIPELHPALAQVIDRSLILDYRRRIQNTAQFLAELKTTTQNGSVRARGVARGGSPGGIPYVLIVAGTTKGAKWALPSDTDIIVGRSPKECNIVIRDPGVSRRHCTVRYISSEGSFTVTDVSTNGTFTKEQQRLGAHRPQAINAPCDLVFSGSNTVIRIGVE